MAAADAKLPPVSAESRRIAAERFERANQVTSTGNYDYGIQLLLTCCTLDPGNFLFRQTLRRTQKAKFNNNLRGSRLAFLTTFRSRTRLKSAKRSGEYAKVLEHGETILSKNPWDSGVQLDMALAAEALGLSDQAIFILDQARQKNPQDPTINRALARLFEKRGNFKSAISLWQLVREAVPSDVEAAHKAKDLAASETIQRGGYESVAPASESEDGEESAVSPASDTKLATKAQTAQAPAVDPQDRLQREVAPILARLESNPSDPHLYTQLALVYRRNNLRDRARAVLEQGMGPTGNHYLLQMELMESDIDTMRKNLAVADKKLDMVDDDPDATHNPEDLIKIKNKLQKEITNREIELARTRSDRFPTDMVHRLELGMRLAQAGMIDEAISALQKARKDPKVGWKASLHLGLCFVRRNNWRLAQSNLDEALAGVPQSDEDGRKEILFHLANGYAEAGDLQKAVDLGHDLANIDYVYRDIGKLIDDWNSRLQEA
jgi:tetratricopeptide (TPR) repeat protein